jgi:mRNA interferase MazF
MSSSEPYCPDSSDVIWLDFNPQAGREQAGRRPAFVLSPRKYNRLSGLCLVCPMTNQVKGYPFEVAMPPGGKVGGVILADQVESLSWLARRAGFIGSYPEIADDVVAKIQALLPR